MPAAAVIPAPTAYINVVAVKKLVVGVIVCPFLRVHWLRPVYRRFRLTVSFAVAFHMASLLCGIVQRITVKKLECSKQMYI